MIPVPLITFESKQGVDNKIYTKKKRHKKLPRLDFVFDFYFPPGIVL